MTWLRKAIQILDRLVKWVGAYLMVVMVVIITWEVFSRYVLHHTPAWNEEIVLLLMMWFGFLSIAMGFRKQLHIRISILVDRFPKGAQWAVDKLANLLVIAFGALLTVEGIKFVRLTWPDKLPVTQMPQGIQYLIIPAAGVLTVIYGLMWLFGWKEENA